LAGSLQPIFPGRPQEAAVLTDDKRVVPLILLAQAAASLGLAVSLGLWQGRIVGMSALVGGMIAVIPNAFLAARLFGRRAGASGVALMRAAWIGEIGKVALTVFLFAAVFAAPGPISAPALFGGFIAAQLVVFGALLGGGRVGGARA
jgi:ATP synthase protein I